MQAETESPTETELENVGKLAEHGDELEIETEIEDVGKRIDKFLAEELTGLSRSGVQKLLEDGKITVCGETVRPSYKIRRGDFVIVRLAKTPPLAAYAENIPIDVIFEDAEVVVVNKPKGMVVHPAAGHAGGTLVNALLWRCAGSLSGINGVLRPGIVHRIDKDTSGILVAAKTNAAHISLSAQFAEHSITRKYLAVVLGNIKEDGGTIDKPIGRHPLERKKMAVAANGRRAVTHFTVLERFGNFTLIEARLETGRTHQIRVHMTSLGHPLLGDSVYSSAKRQFGVDGQMLHAEELGFVHPASGEYMSFHAEPPHDFSRVVNMLRAR